MRRPPSLLSALVTPFAGDGSLDTAAHRFNLRTLSEGGVRGFLLGGSTGEGPYLEPGERSELMSQARAELGDSTYLLCGVAAESLWQAVAQIDEAVTGGADAALVVTPTSLVRGRHDLVAAFFREIAVASPLPIFLYTVPNVTGYTLPVETIIDLSHASGIVGVKDSSGEPDRAGAIRAGAPDDFLIMIGSSRAIATGREQGAHGAITASSNYAARLVQRVVDGEPGTQELLTPLVAHIEPNGVPGTKVAAELTGLRVGVLRRPLLPVDPEIARDIAAALGEPARPVEAQQPPAGHRGGSGFGQLESGR